MCSVLIADTASAIPLHTAESREDDQNEASRGKYFETYSYSIKSNSQVLYILHLKDDY